MGTQRHAAFQLGHHEVIEIAAFVVAWPSYSENVVAELSYQQRDLIGQRNGLSAWAASQLREPCGASYGLGTATPVVPPGGLKLPLAPFGVLQGVIDAVLQETNKLLEITEDVEDITMAGNLQ
jgi:hypothetical protein